MQNHFYFKSLNLNQEKEVKELLSLATAKIADGVINNKYPFILSPSAFSIYDSASEEILFNYDRTADSIIHVGLVKKENYPIRFNDAKPSIKLVESVDNKPVVKLTFNADQTDKNQLNQIYLKLVELSKKNPYGKFSIDINGKIPSEFKDKTLYELAPKFKDEIDTIVLEASKINGLHPVNNEYGVKIKEINKAISELSEKLKSNNLYNCEELNALVTAFKQGKITKENFNSNCNTLIEEFKSRNAEFNEILNELKSSEQYKSIDNKEELNKQLDALNLRKKYVYDKESKEDISSEFYGIVTNYKFNTKKEEGKISSEKESDYIKKIKCVYLHKKNIVKSLSKDGTVTYNSDDFSEGLIKDISKLVEDPTVSFDEFKDKVDYMLSNKKTKEDLDIKQMNEWIEQNFSYRKLPQQLEKVKKEVEAHKMTYKEFLEAYFNWVRSKNRANSEFYPTSKTYKLWYRLYKDQKCNDPLKLRGYSVSVEEFKTGKEANALMLSAKSIDSLTKKFSNSIKELSTALVNKFGEESNNQIRGIEIKFSDGVKDNDIVKKYGADNWNNVVKLINNDLMNYQANLDEDDTDSDIEAVEFDETDE